MVIKIENEINPDQNPPGFLACWQGGTPWKYIVEVGLQNTKKI